MLPCSRDWIRVLFPLEDPISRPRRAGRSDSMMLGGSVYEVMGRSIRDWKGMG
jgi:hypothetical protein